MVKQNTSEAALDSATRGIDVRSIFTLIIVRLKNI